MTPVRVIYHCEEGGWWAKSPDVKGWTAIADTYEKIVPLVEEGIPFALELDHEVELEHILRSRREQIVPPSSRVCGISSGPVQTGSYGQHQIHALALHFGR